MHVSVDELRLDEEPDAVPRARSFAARTARVWGVPDLVTDVELVATELVTNALLHAQPPVRLRLSPLEDGIRIEVADGSRLTPIRALADQQAMTGRGLALIEALGYSWGVSPLADGKVVWCELTHAARRGEPDEADIDSWLRMWDDEPGREPLFTVHLGDVPTDLLLAAKAHVDNLVREFTLAATGAASGQGAAIPMHLSQLVQTVVHRFASARQAIKRQALAAAARGQTRTRLTLTLPASAAAAGEEYLLALDEADAYARAARLLTLETPPQHRLFRRWYVESLVVQLRRAAAGQPPLDPPSLEQRLLDEFDVVTAAQRTSEHAARLQSVTASLASATSTEQVATVVVADGVAALGASGGSLLVPADEHLAVPASVGYGDALLSQLRSERRDADLPAAAAMRTGKAVWLESRQARDQRFPELTGLEPRTVSMCAVPLVVRQRVLGALRFSFDSPRLFDDDERRFVIALAAQTAQALERSELYAAERAARDAAESLAARLGRLQRVTAELTGATDVDQVADIVVTHAADALGANLATLSLLTDDATLRVVRMRGANAATVERWRTFPVAAELPASEAVRTGAPVVVASRDELYRRFPLLTGQAPEERSLVCVPLRVGDRCLGAISLSFPPDLDVHGPAQVAFLTSLADACAQAIDRAHALAAAAEANDKLAFLAEASTELARSLDYRTTLAQIARLIVPRLADWCAVHVVDEDGKLDPVTIAHVEPSKVAFAGDLQRRYPVDSQARAGVANVVRTGVAELYPTLTDEMLARAAADAEQLRLFRQLGLTSGLIVPLTAHSATFGAVSLFQSESGRRFGPADLSFAEDLVRRAAVAVDNARAFRQQTGKLAAITRVAEAAQQAILAPVPDRVGSIALAAAYVSAAREALIGGDLYAVAPRPGGVRLLIGDVRGKGLDAVRMATVVLGEFRSAAVDLEHLTALARQMDTRLRPYLGPEDFVTALLAEVHDDGRCEVVSCGHPPALLCRGGRISEFGRADSLPLGLGAAPSPVRVGLTPGDRLLLYTDGIVEARRPDGSFVDLGRVVAPLVGGDVRTVLDDVLRELRATVGGDLTDDLALLVAEYQPVRPVSF